MRRPGQLSSQMRVCISYHLSMMSKSLHGLAQDSKGRVYMVMNCTSHALLLQMLKSRVGVNSLPYQSSKYSGTWYGSYVW